MLYNSHKDSVWVSVFFWVVLDTGLLNDWVVAVDCYDYDVDQLLQPLNSLKRNAPTTDPQFDLLKVKQPEVRQLVNDVGAVMFLWRDRIQQQTTQHSPFTATSLTLTRSPHHNSLIILFLRPCKSFTVLRHVRNCQCYYYYYYRQRLQILTILKILMPTSFRNKIHSAETHNRFTALFPGPPGWASARRELLDFMAQGKINRRRHTDHQAGCHSIWTNQCPPSPSPHIFYRPDALPVVQPTGSKHWMHSAEILREIFQSALCSFNFLISHVTNISTFT